MEPSLEDRLKDDLRNTFQRLGLENSVYAVAVSGGADSMALALLLQALRPSSRLRAFTVDHGLRHGSAAEARWTKVQLEKHDIACDILTVAAASLPKGNIQAAARGARYALMAQACTEHDIDLLCTAHTLNDQAETVLARLSRGSGTNGLGAMAQIAPVPSASPKTNLRLFRPLLSTSRADLRAYLASRLQRWAEDPSNANTRFDRIRIRAMLDTWQASGFEIERIAATALNMRRSNDALQFYVTQALKEMTTDMPGNAIAVSKSAFFALPIDTQLSGLRACLQRVSSDKRSIRLVKLEDALERAKSKDPSRFTLHGCLLEVTSSQILITAEHP